MKMHIKNQQGMMIIEMMIGLMIALFSAAAVYGIYGNYEGQKRTTVQGGSAIQNASLGLHQINHDGKQAGYGLSNPALLGCTVRAWDEQKGRSFDFIMAPANITFGANANTPDMVTFIIGSSDASFNALKIMQNMPNPSSVYKVDQRYGTREGDIIIVAEPGKDCTMAQVSTLPTNAGNTDNIIHNSGNYTDPGTGAQIPTRYNKPAGLGVSYSILGRVYNLGPMPRIVTYSINANQLAVSDTMTGEAAMAVTDHIVHLQAVYGKDTNADGIVDVWNRTVPANNLEWAQLIAVKVALLSRSALREREDAGGNCIVTTNPTFNWDNGVAGASMDISHLPDWQCYRYRMLHVTIPFRNMIWSGDA